MKKIKLKCVVDRNINYPQTSKNPFSGVYSDLRSKEYTIFINQITCLSVNVDSGTDIRLACGLEVTADENIDDVLKLIEKA